MNILLFGAGGKMGQEVLSLLRGQKETVIGFDKNPTPFPCFYRLEELPTADVAIDFSSAEGISERLLFCERRQIPLVEGVTGIPEAARKDIENVAKSIPLFISENFSLGVFAMKKLVAMAAEMLTGFDKVVVERHRRGKKDAPSGTALVLAESMRGAEIASVRCGTICGEHEADFEGEFETLKILHTAKSRRVFAEGAVKAARWLIGKSPALYGMEDLFVSLA